MNICELKAEYKRISDLPIMKYETMRMELLELIRHWNVSGA